MCMQEYNVLVSKDFERSMCSFVACGGTDGNILFYKVESDSWTVFVECATKFITKTIAEKAKILAGESNVLSILEKDGVLKISM